MLRLPVLTETWFAIIGPQIKAKGEVSAKMQLYHRQYAQTLAELLGLNFHCEHPVSDGFKTILLNK